MEVRLSARDGDHLFVLAEEVRAVLEQTPGTTNIRDNWGSRSKKIVVKINQARARRAGVSSMDIALSLQSSLDGYETTQYREGVLLWGGFPYFESQFFPVEGRWAKD